MLNRQEVPEIKDAIDYHLTLKPYRKFALKNGVDVYVVEAGPQDVLQVELVFDAGNYHEEHNLVAAATNNLLKNGTSKRSAFEINEHFEYYGAYLNRNCYNETSNVVLHCLTKHTAELLPVMRELITEAVFPQEELNIYQQNMQQRLSVSLKKCDFVANRLIDVYLFGEKHPYGRFSTAQDFAVLQREQLVAFYDQYYRHGRCRIFVAGRVPEDLDALLDEYFGDLPLSSKAMSKKIIPFEPATEKHYRISNDPDGVQGAIRIASPFPSRHDADYPKVQVLNTVFGGFFGSRLMSNIREEKGYTYGIHSYLQSYQQESAWMISTEAGRDVCEATVKEVYHEMRRLREELIEEEELLLVRNYLIGTLLGDLDGPFQIIGRWKNIVLHGMDERFFYNSIEIIKTITVEELQQLAVKYLQPERFYELVVV